MTDDQKKRLKALALSGMVSGAVLGTGSRLLGNFTKAGDLVKGGLAGAAIGGTAAASSGALGEAILGHPGASEEDPYTRRGAIGGAAGGTILGGLSGAAIGSGTVKSFAKKYLSESAKAELEGTLRPTGKNILIDALKRNALKGGLKGALIGATGGATILGGLAAYQGADEGMQADILANARRKHARKRYRDEDVG